jgi:molybdenum cofactor guanylyltransferase
VSRPSERSGLPGGPPGVVLTGGASRRMGRTKALIEVEGRPMATWVAAALLEAGCSPVVALGGDANELEPLDLRIVADTRPGQGPLGGVISALERVGAGADHVFVVACDVPALRGADLVPFIDAARDHPEVDVVVARTDRLEPACALWSSRSLHPLREVFATGERALHRAIGRLDAHEIDVRPGALRNINVPADLDR